MVKRATLFLGAIGLVSAVWSGGWFYGQSELRTQIDAQITEWGAQGVAVSYTSLEIGGFPFAYRGRVVEPKTQAMIMSAQGPAVTDWRSPWLSFESSLADFGVVSFALPDQQSARILPQNGAPPIDLAIRSSGLQGRLTQEGAFLRVDGGGDAIEVEVTSLTTPPYTMSVSKVTAHAAAPMQEAGQITASLELDGAAADGAAWRLFDPNQIFPRTPANLTLSGSADATPGPNNTIRISRVKLDRFVADIAGVTLDGSGEADLANGQPDGALTLRFQGLGGFFDNAALAGFLPEKQASLYRVMLDSFARTNNVEGEQLFTIAFKGGYIYVNDRPTFIPAPVFP